MTTGTSSRSAALRAAAVTASIAIAFATGPHGVGNAVHASDTDARPNIVLINVDDMGYNDCGPFGSTDTRTPNLDRMAAEGRCLTSHYAAPVCTPSRASLMTGCYPKRALPVAHVLFPVSSIGLHPDEVTIADALKASGYATACVGKWHLGDQPVFLPTRQGFDEYYGLPYSNDMGTVQDGAKSNPGRPLPDRKTAPLPETLPPDGVRGNAQPPLPLLEGEEVIERVTAEGQTTLTERYTTRAADFIRRNKERPFFLYMPHSAVHFPLYPGMRFRGKSGGDLQADWVEEVDWSVGRVLDTVRELGLDEKTLVLFTSDNGGPINHGASNKPLRGGKGSTWEGGVRTPLIAWWPGKVPAGTRSSHMTAMMDLLPTICHITGTELPDRKLDGINIWPSLSGTADASLRNEYLFFRGLKLEAVRSGNWKLHIRRNALFNLAEDIGESMNVIDDHPDVVRELRQLAAQCDTDLGNEQIGPGCRPLGRTENPVPLIAPDIPAAQ